MVYNCTDVLSEGTKGPARPLILLAGLQRRKVAADSAESVKPGLFVIGLVVDLSGDQRSLGLLLRIARLNDKGG